MLAKVYDANGPEFPADVWRRRKVRQVRRLARPQQTHRPLAQPNRVAAGLLLTDARLTAGDIQSEFPAQLYFTGAKRHASQTQVAVNKCSARMLYSIAIY